MYWKELKKSGEYLRYITGIWRHEKTLPKWYLASSRLWNPTFESFIRWTASNQEIWGLFDDDEFMACVYIEKQDKPSMAIIHFSSGRKIDSDIFITKCSELRDMLFHRGVKHIRGWMLKRNFVLCKLMAQIGFKSTGFRMDQGSSHGRVLSWDLQQIKTI